MDDMAADAIELACSRSGCLGLLLWIAAEGGGCGGARSTVIVNGALRSCVNVNRPFFFVMFAGSVDTSCWCDMAASACPASSKGGGCAVVAIVTAASAEPSAEAREGSTGAGGAAGAGAGAGAGAAFAVAVVVAGVAPACDGLSSVNRPFLCTTWHPPCSSSVAPLAPPPSHPSPLQMAASPLDGAAAASSDDSDDDIGDASPQAGTTDGMAGAAAPAADEGVQFMLPKDTSDGAYRDTTAAAAAGGGTDAR
jgi:hypothetical protein